MFKKAVWSVAVLLAVGVGARVQASDAMEAIVASYLTIQASLAADKIDDVKPAAKAISEQAVRWERRRGDREGAKAIADAADIKATRTAFGDLSDAVIAAGKAEGWKDVPT